MKYVRMSICAKQTTEIVLIILFMLILISCSKKENEDTSTINDYYATVTYGGEIYTFNGDDYKGNHSNSHELGGFISPGRLITSTGLGIAVVFEQSVSQSDFNDLLVGKRVYFNGNDGPFPSVTNFHHVANGLSTWAVDDPGKDYYVEISSLEDLGADANMTRRIFAVRGIFKVLFEQDSGITVQGSGEFYMQWGTDFY